MRTEGGRDHETGRRQNAGDRVGKVICSAALTVMDLRKGSSFRRSGYGRGWRHSQSPGSGATLSSYASYSSRGSALIGGFPVFREAESNEGRAGQDRLAPHFVGAGFKLQRCSRCAHRSGRLRQVCVARCPWRVRRRPEPAAEVVGVYALARAAANHCVVRQRSAGVGGGLSRRVAVSYSIRHSVWRVDRRLYQNDALRGAAGCLKGFYLRQAELGVNRSWVRHYLARPVL